MGAEAEVQRSRGSASQVVHRVELTGSGFKLALRLPTSLEDPADTLTLEQFVSLTMKKRGVELRLVIQNEPSSTTKVDSVLLKTIARAHRWFDHLLSGEVKSLTAIATCEGLNHRFVGKIVRLAFLAPEIVEAIAEGKQPPELSVRAFDQARSATSRLGRSEAAAQHQLGQFSAREVTIPL
jgi:hypothetical protein